MFSTKKFNDTKTTKFKSDKQRKQYFAIKNYYKKKSATIKTKQTQK